MNKKSIYTDLSVLYLEDEPLIAFDTAEFLRELGFGHVECCYNLNAANMAVAQSRFDIAVLDINVDRGQTSIALGQRLKQDGTAVIFASGNSSDAQALREDGFDFLDKPFSHADLQEMVIKALGISVSV